ncbi:hypothetical protein AB9K34_12085 [Sedimentitalea sp. XS_ASV28]|uniref:hypothetical protein n=1 Tax=Sedimentitalea sp. XS_ASV28 TaxID=3241296 RepID=UPI0035194011
MTRPVAKVWFGVGSPRSCLSALRVSISPGARVVRHLRRRVASRILRHWPNAPALPDCQTPWTGPVGVVK